MPKSGQEHEATMRVDWPLRWLMSGVVVVSTTLGANAQDCCAPVPCVTQRVVYKTVWDREAVQAQRIEYEQGYEDHQITVQRSEERRVGKECRPRRAARP